MLQNIEILSTPAEAEADARQAQRRLLVVGGSIVRLRHPPRPPGRDATPVPPEAAQEVADQLVAAGIHGILNFSPVTLYVPDHVTVNAVDLAAQLEQLAFAIHDAEPAS